jgi:NADPH:quinone reductase-like Zn-dependent oxidoreductase
VALTFLRKVGVGARDTVLVSGASGAVGSATVQLARSLGARVVAAVGSDRGADWLRRLPGQVAPDLVVDYGADPEFAALVREVTPAGASIYVETASDPAVWAEALRALARRATVVVIGSHAGPVVQLDNNWLFRQRVTIIGSSGSSLAAYSDALGIAGDGRVVPNIDTILPISKAADAYRRLVERQNQGKIVLRIGDDVA